HSSGSKEAISLERLNMSRPSARDVQIKKRPHFTSNRYKLAHEKASGGRMVGFMVPHLPSPPTSASLAHHSAPVRGATPSISYSRLFPHGPLRIQHASGEQRSAAQTADPQGHFPVVLPRCQDRRARPQRRGQIHPAAHHGRR